MKVWLLDQVEWSGQSLEAELEMLEFEAITEPQLELDEFDSASQVVPLNRPLPQNGERLLKQGEGNGIIRCNEILVELIFFFLVVELMKYGSNMIKLYAFDKFIDMIKVYQCD